MDNFEKWVVDDLKRMLNKISELEDTVKELKYELAELKGIREE